jgi:hypothetical protein
LKGNKKSPRLQGVEDLGKNLMPGVLRKGGKGQSRNNTVHLFDATTGHDLRELLSRGLDDPLWVTLLQPVAHGGILFKKQGGGIRSQVPSDSLADYTGTSAQFDNGLDTGPGNRR